MQTLLHGDCLDLLPTLEAGSIDAIVTDPPYGLSFMGKRWDYDVPSEAIWRECLRVLKPGGHLLSFAGTRTQHRMAVRIEDAGFEIRDMIAWVYGSGFPKSHNGPWGGTALKPALEPITVARKPLEGTVAANVLAYGTGGLNIDGCRVGSTVETWPKSRSYAPGQIQPGGKGATQSTGDAPAGRWPANIIHDGSEEVLAGFPNDTNRFFYSPKASKKDRDEGLDGFEAKPRQTMGSGIGGQPDQDIANNKNFHPTVKPTDLMRYLCRLVTPSGGTVLDPFMGSGSTGKAARLEGFQFIGIERDPEYFEIAKRRIEEASAQIPLIPA